MPHYLFSWSLICLATVALKKYLDDDGPIWLSLIIPAVLFGGLFLPSVGLPFVTGIPFIWLFGVIRDYFRSHRLKLRVKTTIGMLLIVISAVIPLFFTWREKFNGFPWVDWYRFEINTWNSSAKNFNLEMILAWGVMPILSIPSIIKSFRYNRSIDMYLSVWALIGYILLPVATPLSISKYRLISMAPFIPFSLLAAKSLRELSHPLLSRKLKTMIVGLIIISFITSSSYILYHITLAARIYPVYSNVYLPSDMWRMIKYIRKNIPQKSIFVSDWVGGNLIPGFAPVVAFTGHPVHTMNFYTKTSLYTSFYSGIMTASEARSFLDRYRIEYVVYGPAEEKIGPAVTTYPFLIPIFREGNYTLYRIIGKN
jgi:hypothetical protein